MIVEVNSVKYYVRWSHRNPNSEDTKVREIRKGLFYPDKGASYCLITKNEPSGPIVGVGAANVFCKDNFDKDTGRKETLKRALVSSIFNKAEKQLFWNKLRNNGTFKN